MTNADKYLKDEVAYKDLFIDFDNFLGKHLYNSMEQAFKDFMESKAKPILTEDEKVILKNIDKKYINIKRNDDGDLIFVAYGSANFYIPVYNHLFLFIKSRRRI